MPKSFEELVDDSIHAANPGVHVRRVEGEDVGLFPVRVVRDLGVVSFSKLDVPSGGTIVYILKYLPLRMCYEVYFRTARGAKKSPGG